MPSSPENGGPRYLWITVPVAPTVKGQIAKFARERGRSMSFVFRQAITEYMEAHASDPKVRASRALLDFEPLPLPRRVKRGARS